MHACFSEASSLHLARNWHCLSTTLLHTGDGAVAVLIKMLMKMLISSTEVGVDDEGMW